VQIFYNAALSQKFNQTFGTWKRREAEQGQNLQNNYACKALLGCFS
jgi:hypothetical protein